MPRVLKILVALAALVLAGLVVLLFTDFESPRLSRALIRRAAAAYGVELEVERATLNLRRGLVLEGAAARSEAGGERLATALDRLVLEHRLWPLLGGELVVERLRLERPVIEMVSAAPALPAAGRSSPAPRDAGTRPPALEDESSRLRLEIGEVVLESGRLSSTSTAGSGATLVEGLDLVLREVATDPEAASLLLAISGRGWLEIDSLSLDGHGLAGIAASFRADAGRYLLDSFESNTPAGVVTVDELEVDLAQSPYRYRLAMRAGAIDLNRILGLPGGLGAARLELRGTGEGPGLSGAVAEMTLRIEAGTLPSVALLSQIDRLVGTRLDGVAYEALDSRVSLAGGKLEIDPTRLVTEIARLEVAGALDPDGSLDLAVAVGLPRDLFSRADVSDEALQALTDRRGWLTIPLRVTGTVREPRFGPDLEAIGEVVRRQVGRAEESLERRLRADISGLIRR